MHVMHDSETSLRSAPRRLVSHADMIHQHIHALQPLPHQACLQTQLPQGQQRITKGPDIDAVVDNLHNCHW